LWYIECSSTRKIAVQKDVQAAANVRRECSSLPALQFLAWRSNRECKADSRVAKKADYNDYGL